MHVTLTIALSALLSSCAAVTSAPTSTTGGLSPPSDVDTLVLCYAPFERARVGSADCAVSEDPVTLTAVTDALDDAVPVEPAEAVCTIGAGNWDVVWLSSGAFVDRVAVSDAGCLPASRPDEQEQYAVPESVLGILRTVHDGGATAGGAFDGLAEANPAAALCAQRYPRDLPEQPLALDGVVLGVSLTDPATTPESPGVPFTEVDVLVLEALTGTPGQRLQVRALGEPPDAKAAIGERLLIANTSPFLSACGFTQPYSRATAAQWSEAFD